MRGNACACCLVSKRRCDPAKDRCKRCSHALRQIRFCPPFPYGDVQEQFRDKGWQDRLHSLELPNGNCSGLDLNILVWSLKKVPTQKTAQKPPAQIAREERICTGEIQKSLRVEGSFAADNKSLILDVDDVARQFSADVRARGGASRLISLAALAGGYLRIACSFSGDDVQHIPDRVRESFDGNFFSNDFSEYNVYLHFRYILVCRFSELATEVLTAIRLADPASMDLDLCWNAYAAAVILYCEVDHFRGNLRNGPLSKSAPPELEGPFVKWLASAGQELWERMTEGCHRFRPWHAVVEGSVKCLREKRRGETLTIRMHLRQNKPTFNNPKIWSDIPSQPSSLCGGDLSPPMSQSISHSSCMTLQDNSPYNYSKVVNSLGDGPSLAKMTETPPFQPIFAANYHDLTWSTTSEHAGDSTYLHGGLNADYEPNYSQDNFQAFPELEKEGLGQYENSDFNLDTFPSRENIGSCSTYDPPFDFDFVNHLHHLSALD